jgi:hypothetical protein
LESTTTVIESQLDWLTCSAPCPQDTRALAHLAEFWMNQEREAGGRVRPFRLSGYVGEQCGRVRYGERDGRCLVQLSGDLAETRFDTLYPLSDHQSRIDLAVTVRDPLGFEAWPERNYEEAYERRVHDVRASLPVLVQNGDGGSTFYLGDRVSDFYLRVYNKEAECRIVHDEAGAEHYRACVRYELEVKGVNAPRWAKTLFNIPDRSDVVQALVWSFSDERGLSLPFRARRRPSDHPRLPEA